MIVGRVMALEGCRMLAVIRPKFSEKREAMLMMFQGDLDE